MGAYARPVGRINRLTRPGWRWSMFRSRSPGPGEVLVRVAACGFCHHDRAVMAGVLRRGVRPGVVLGHEISGVVEEAGAGVVGVSSRRPGGLAAHQRLRAAATVAATAGSTAAATEKASATAGTAGSPSTLALSEHSLVPVPAGLDLVPASLLACPMGVALEAVESIAAVQAGETVVVTGAGGGLGVHAVQAAAALGCRVLAVTSSPGKADRLRGYGAAEALETEGLDFAELVMALTGDEGADVVIDTVGSVLFPSTLRSLRQSGRLVLLGEVAGGRMSINPAEIIFRDAKVLGASGVSRRALEQAGVMAAAGRITPVIHQVLPLEGAAKAFELLSDRTPLGRVVLVP